MIRYLQSNQLSQRSRRQRRSSKNVQSRDESPKPSNVADIDHADYPADAFVNVIEFAPEEYFHTVRYAAKKFGLNISQTAELLGAPYRTVQNWFNGTSRPSPWVERLVIEKIQGTL